MKPRISPCLHIVVAATALAVGIPTRAADLTWDNGAATGNWNTTDTNWTGAIWNNSTPDNAIFNTNTGTLNLTEPISAGSFTFGLTNANTAGAFSGASLAIAGNLVAQADGNNGPGGPTLSFSNNVTVGGDVRLSRRVFEITAGNFTANRLISADSWGRLQVSGGTVTMTNGIDDSVLGSGNTLSVFLQGGSLYTSYIKTTSAGFTSIGNDGVVLNGGTLFATANSGDFIQTWDPGWGNRNDIGVGTGGANINTNGFNTTINKAMVNYGGAGTLTKSGSGTLTLTAYNHYTGGTTVNGGTLEVAGQNSGYGWLRGAVTVNSGGTLKFTGGDGTGFGWNNPVTNLTINGGTFDAAGGAHIGFGNYMTLALNNGGTISGSGQWNGDGRLGFSSSGDSTNTISGSWNLRGDDGVDHTFTVADGAAATDLLVSANFSNLYSVALVKAGAGTMKLTGNSSYYGQTRVNAGTLVAASNTALGPGGWDGNSMTWVYDGATLALEGGISLDEHLHVFGAGVGGNGAIRSLSGNNALTLTFGNSGSGPGFSIDSNTTVGVDADTLTATGFYESGGSFGLTKVGAGTLNLTHGSTYTGATTVSAGTLLVTGALGNSAVNVASNATIGGSGTIGGPLSFAGDSFFDIFSAVVGNDPLAVTNTVSFGSGFGIDNLTGINWASVALGTYTLIDSTQDFSLAGLDNWGIANAFSVGSGKSAYFANGSLELVVIPEPGAALLGGLGLLALLRRRR